MSKLLTARQTGRLALVLAVSAAASTSVNAQRTMAEADTGALADDILSAPADLSGLEDPTLPPSAKRVVPREAPKPRKSAPVRRTSKPKPVRRYVPPVLSLHAIMFSEDRRLAIINGVVLSEGQRVADARLVSIQPGGVTIEQRGRTRTLRMAAANVKRPSDSAP